MNKQMYLDYIQAAVLEGRSRYETDIAAWRNTYQPDRFLGMYTPPGNIALLVQTEAFLYRITGDETYGEQAKKMLLAVEAFKDIVPAEVRERHPEYAQGVTSFEPLFQGTHYLTGYMFMKDSPLLAPHEKRQIEGSIRSAVQAMVHYPEWGAHNRSMLRVFTLSLAIAALGDTEETREWAKLRDYLAQESFGGWSIEDAELYLPLWLSSCIVYAEQTGQEDAYFAKPQTKFYFDYITRLIAPFGQIPDFGDANHNSFWYLWLACLEKGAARYRCGHMKHAARQIYDYAVSRLEGPPSIYIAANFAYAYVWADDSIEPVPLQTGSELVLEDVIGKKIAFRDGWDADAAYMLLNYRDEGDYAAVPRQYLLRTINAPAEKAHHGHADENSIVYLARSRNVLLHDGGYRDQAPNGKYRADIYHNRLVFREGAPEAGGSMYDFLHDDGKYHRVSSEKLHFQTFDTLDYSRTRVRDPYRRVMWDRSIVYLREEGVYIIADWTQALADMRLATVNLWHPSTVLEAGDGYYVGQVREIEQGPGDPKPVRNRDELALLIEFPQSPRPNGHETIRRNYADSEMVYEWDSRNVAAGTMNAFVTVLTPFALAAGEPRPAGRVAVTGRTPDSDQLSLRYEADGVAYDLAIKLDLEKGTFAREGYPKYSWERSKLAYGKLETDADFAFVRTDGAGGGRYGFVNGIGVAYDGAQLFRTPPMSSYQFQTSAFETADHKWRAWDGVFK